MYVCICPTQYTSDAYTYAYVPLCVYTKVQDEEKEVVEEDKEEEGFGRRTKVY